MIRQYNFDHSRAVAVGAIYPVQGFYGTDWVSVVHNGKDPSSITVSSIGYGAQNSHIILLATAENPAVVHQKLVELKSQFGITSGPIPQPPGDLEVELAKMLMSMQAAFERVKAHRFSR